MMIRPRARVASAILAVCFGAAGRCLAAGGAAPPAGAHGDAKGTPRQITAKPIALSGGGPDGVSMDYLACDRDAKRVWVPAGNTGSVDVIQIESGKLTRIEGFPTAEVERRGGKRTVGPSSATIGDGVVYVGNRADLKICAVDVRSLTKGSCVGLESSPDGLAYIAATREVWVTTPRDRSITILDASAPGSPRVKSRIPLDGEPEGYAVDTKHGIFYTNLEDKDRTLAIDVHSHSIASTWKPECGEDGPRGLALDVGSGILFVACTDHAEALDTKDGGAILSKVSTGPGVDNIDYLPSRRLLYVAAGQAARLTIARVENDGKLTPVATGPTSLGARVVVVDAEGAAYVADSQGGRILVFPPDPR